MGNVTYLINNLVPWYFDKFPEICDWYLACYVRFKTDNKVMSEINGYWNHGFILAVLYCDKLNNISVDILIIEIWDNVA